ncbi:Hypothetical protein CINCED_3A007060 [Cinara cedri]|uniref:Uncharacterized protein n=1 Tax=Cinara cedri TaxID=506608 RepID=A0A5E4ND49_9HEMI|nr:Hypothetical protein CINCED_3A007060 [Cinara cedri]
MYSSAEFNLHPSAVSSKKTASNRQPQSLANRVPLPKTTAERAVLKKTASTAYPDDISVVWQHGEAASSVNSRAHDFDSIPSSMYQWSEYGDGDAASSVSQNCQPSRSSQNVVKSAAKKSTAKCPKLNENKNAFDNLWAVTDDPFKFAKVKKQSKAKKQQQIFNVYTSDQPKASAPRGSAVSSSYINRQKKLQETQAVNRGLIKKLLQVKSTITRFRYVIILL